MVLPRGQGRKNHRHARLMTEIMLRGFCSQRRPDECSDSIGLDPADHCGYVTRKQATKPLPEIGSR
jgi:hypothetical protein